MQVQPSPSPNLAPACDQGICLSPAMGLTPSKRTKDDTPRAVGGQGDSLSPAALANCSTLHMRVTPYLASTLSPAQQSELTSIARNIKCMPDFRVVLSGTHQGRSTSTLSITSQELSSIADPEEWVHITVVTAMISRICADSGHLGSHKVRMPNLQPATWPSPEVLASCYTRYRQYRVANCSPDFTKATVLLFPRFQMNHFYLITATKAPSGVISMASYDPKHTGRTSEMALLLRLAAHMFRDMSPSTYDHNMDVSALGMI